MKFNRTKFIRGTLAWLVLLLAACGGGTTSSSGGATLSSNAALSGLSLSVGALTPAFNSTTLTYSDGVSIADASISVIPTVADANATVKVNNVAVASGSASSPIALAVGSNPISVVVTAQDGTTSKIYSINVTRPGVALIPATSNIITFASANITVTLAAAAGAGGTAVALLSSNPAAVSVPASVTVPAASTLATFSATSVASSAASVTITATLGADAPTATVNVIGQCVVPSDCGADTACQTHTCIANTCGVANTSSGFVVAAQTAGDCHQLQCDGAGNISSVIYNTDVPIDGNVCTNDICIAGAPSNPPMANFTACSNSACSTGDMCMTGVCTGGTPVVDGTACSDGNSCTTLDVCTSGVCSGGAPVSCGSGLVCQPLSGLCL